VDDLPDTPGLKEAWGKGVYWCPWCDGYEHRDEPFGILGALPDVVGSVLEVYTLNKDIVAFVNGTQTADAEAELGAKYPNWEAQLEAYNVRLENATIESFERIQDGGELKDRNGTRQLDIFRVHFTNGSSVDRNAFITNFPSEQRSDLPRQLGLAMLGNKIDATTNPGMRTSVSGVFAVGDCNSDNSTNVPHAMFSGKRAAVYLHGMLWSTPCFAYLYFQLLSIWLDADQCETVEMAKEESKAVINKRGGVKVMLKETEKRMGDEMQMIYNRARGL
jgi:thioredoxin reductase